MSRASWHSPMLATLVKKPFSEKGWIFERKLDGVRCLVHKVNGKVTLYSRNKKVMNKSCPELVALFEKQKKDFVLDGEIVALKKNATSFSTLQQRLHITCPEKVTQRKMRLAFFAFDLLHCDGEDLRKLPLEERKDLLKKSISFKGALRYTAHIQTKGEEYFKKACQKKWEGVIAKKALSTYVSKRSKDWQKFKCENRQEFVIAGFTSAQGSRVGFGALILAYYDKGVLRYAGKVGTGFDRAFLKALAQRLHKLKRKNPHFKGSKFPHSVHFVQPKLVCEIAFTEWTKDKKLRHPRFLGLRSDKKASQVKKEG